MKKRKIKITFADFWINFEFTNNFIYKLLQKEYDIEFSEKPDYLFFSCYGNMHLSYNNCIKIFFTGENCTPDFNFCDYAMGFDHLQYQDRYLRLPLYVVRDGYQKLYNKTIKNEEELLNRKFCNFVYSNSLKADPFRLHFLKRLSEYKRIDSGGKLENNIGQIVDDKISFISNYKFTIAFENSSISGYTTEKIMEPMLVNSMPIYWGNPHIDKDFNDESFIYLKKYSDIDYAINEVIRLDNDDKSYLAKLKEPWLFQNTYINWEDRVLLFLDGIFAQNLNDANRRVQYGFIIDHYKNLYLSNSNQQDAVPEKQPNSLFWFIKRINRYCKKLVRKMF